MQQFVIDTHSHLFTEEFADDLHDVLTRAREAGVGRIYMPNIDISTVESLLQVCRAYEGYCFPMLGLHPTSVGEGYQTELDAMKPMLDNPSHPFVAIGEVVSRKMRFANRLLGHWSTTSLWLSIVAKPSTNSMP